MSDGSITVRRAKITDAPEMCRLIHELAEFEKMADKCTATPVALAEMMNEQNGLCGIIAECDGKAVGIAVYSVYKLATFSGRRVVYLEDIYIQEEMRRHGIGGMLFEELKNAARELNAIKIEWKCLAWNTSAREFYSRQGGISDDEWLTYTIDLR